MIEICQILDMDDVSGVISVWSKFEGYHLTRFNRYFRPEVKGKDIQWNVEDREFIPNSDFPITCFFENGKLVGWTDLRVSEYSLGQLVNHVEKHFFIAARLTYRTGQYEECVA